MRRAATVLLGCLLLAGCGQGEALVANDAAAVPPDAVPHDGDTVSGSGRLVQEPGGAVLFCGNESRTDVGYSPGQEPAPVACLDGISIEDADLTAVDDRFEKNGAVEGYATITGVWRGGTVEVQEQGPPAQPGQRAFEEAPCPEPAGGWPFTAESDNMEAEMARVHQSGRVRVGPERFALLRPSRTQVLLGYAVPDEEARVQAQAALDELVPNRACVVVARHTDEQLEAVRDVDWSRFGAVRGYGVGLRQMQAVMHVWALVVTESMAAEAARHPQGLVELAPDLRVVAVADRPGPQEEPSRSSAEPSPVDGEGVTGGGSTSRSSAPPARDSGRQSTEEMTPARAETLVRQLREFAEQPSESAARQLPFAPTVRLGVGDTLLKQLDAKTLIDPAAWSVPTAQGYEWLAEPSLNALELLVDDRPYTSELGPHPHCASPPRPAPPAVNAHHRVSTQPAAADSCLSWYTVDLFLRAGEIEAVTLDLWEP